MLRPRNEAARQQIDRAYADTEKVRREVFETPLTPRADSAMFRKVYPFSPALVENLVAVSSLLQRERTALKVMLQILVDRRETLDLGEIVPVGDLFDAIAEGDEPFTESTRHHFENARNLYRRKPLPLIESLHGIAKAEAETRPKNDKAARALRAEDRLAKTLLLSALAPEVEVLKNLTATRLAALNHGSIRTPIEGREGQEVLRRCRAWAAEIGEVRIDDDPANPTITLQLSAVDTESILADADRYDNAGNRRRLIREILFNELGIEDRDELMLYHEITWRGTQRRFEVIFANVRELPDESLSTHADGSCRYPDSDASVMGGNDIEELGGGRFETVAAVERYSALDQYLMGLRHDFEVPPFFYVESPMNVSPSGGHTAGPRVGVAFSGTRRDVLIADIVEVEGPRAPSADESPRVHRQAFVYVVGGDRTADAADLALLERIRRRWEGFFEEATEGRMRVETRLRVGVSAPPIQ